MYEKIKISPSDARALKDFEDRRVAFARLVEMAQGNWERKNQEITQAGRELWERLGKEYSLDLERVNYAGEGEFLVPLAVRLK